MYTPENSGYASNDDVYFAADEAKKCVSHVKRKADIWYDNLLRNSYLEKLKRSWNSYFGVYYEDNHAISFGGETSELANIAVNHYRNIAQHILTMTTASRPAFKAKAINSDSVSRIQTTLANGLLNYYMREKRLENHLKKAVEYAIVMGSGFIKMDWNATSGELYDSIDPDPIKDADGRELKNEKGEYVDEKGVKLNPFPIYEGDVEFKNMSPFDVVFDSTKENPEHDWVLCRTFKNKFDLAIKYPELADKIKTLRTKSDRANYRVTLSALDETVDVPVYEFYHRKTESMPNGRYIMYLDEEIIPEDTVMPYRRLPVYRIVPSDILGTPYGYTTMFDLLGPQDALNSLHSTVLTNQNAFGVQSILNPSGNGITIQSVTGGLNWIEYNPVAGTTGKPEPLQLTQTPAEIFNYMTMLRGDMEMVSGVNAVSRGNPEAMKGIKSGNALALIKSGSLEFNGGLQQSYIQLIEDIGTGLVELLQDFAQVPRIAEIAGISNTSKMVKFSGKDLDLVRRVVVDVGNALSQSVAGRVQMAENLIQMGLITSPEQYFSVMETGNLDAMTEGAHNQLLLIQGENERLTTGEGEIIAIEIDKHSLHIREHMNVLADPDLRLDPDLLSRTLAHIQEHRELLATADPQTLSIIGEQPLSPLGGTPAGPGTMAPPQPNTQGMGAMDAAMMNPQGQQAAAKSSTGVPSPAKPAQAQGAPNTSGETFIGNI